MSAEATPCDGLAALRDARDKAWHDLRETCIALKGELRRLGSPQAREMMARLQGDIHELRLLRRREISLIASGREPEAATQEEELS